MKIKSSTKKKTLNQQVNKTWWIPILIGLLILSFLFGYISHPGWKFKSSIERVKKSLIKSDQAIMEELRQEIGLYHANGLATIFLDIPFDSLLTIEEKRTEALIAGILLTADEDFVPARMHLNDGDPFNIRIRLKGDWTDHLVGDKWSFRIHIQDDNQAVNGMRRFSIQAPETRNYEKEWVFHQNLLQEDILTTRYYFINVVQNGKYNGIYALEESFTEDLLESQNRREGVIIRFNEDLLWKNWENLGVEDSDIEKMFQEIGNFWLTDVDYSEITAFRQGNISKNELLESELFTAIELLYSFNQGLIPGEEVFDEELWGKYFAIIDLWGAGHATNWINLRFYYNPISGLLEPIAFDALPFEPSAVRETLAFPFATRGFIQKIFALPNVQKEYVNHLERVTQSGYINGLETRYGDEMKHFHQILSGYLEEGVFGDIPPLPWDELELRALILSKSLKSPQPLQGNVRPVQVDGSDFIQIELSNLMVLPVEVRRLILGDRSYEADMKWCSDTACQNQIIETYDSLVLLENSSITLLIPFKDLEIISPPLEQINIEAALLGGSYISINPLDSNYVPQGIDLGAKPKTSLSYALESHPFLVQTDPGKLSVNPGEWMVTGDLILPEGTDLTISAGTSLLFESGKILLVNGTLNLAGTETEPILLSAQEKDWGGIAVFGRGSHESIWTYAIVENTAGINRGGWILTGGITFYKNPVSLSQVKIGVSSAEDALNIIRAQFSLSKVEFYQTNSDAFDGDFSEGIIENCSFQQITGDALDFSGSVVQIDRTEFSDIGDKAISAGEKTILSMTSSRLENVNIGVASKDLSEISLESIEIDSAQFVGLAAYVKKPQFGPAYLNGTNIEIINTELPALCQVDNLLILNGSVIPCEDINVESLYEQGILGN